MDKIIDINEITNIQEIVTSLIESKGLDVADCETKTLQDGSKWIRIFHHAHKNNTVWFTNYIEALSCSNPDKFSKLYLLDHFRRNDGKYEFMLEYPAEFPNQIIRWKQTNNPWRDYNSSTGSTYAPVTGYEAIQVDIVDSATDRGKGLVRHNAAYNTNDPCLLKGCNNTPYWWYGIGQKAIYQGGFTGPNSTIVSIVDLWVRIDNTEYDKLNDVDTEIVGFIKKPDIKKLQDTIHFLEAKLSQNCCESNHCQICQSDKCESCQDSCTQCSSKCESCQDSCTQCSSKNQGCQNACTNCTSKNQKCQNSCTCQSYSCQYYWDCNCSDSDSDCCLAEGTLVLCVINNKYSSKKIEDIQPNDIVVGANGQLNEVYARTDTILGSQRTMFTFADYSLYFTGEHSMWVRYQGKEYFGIHDISGYYREKTAIVDGKPILEWEQEQTYKKNNIVGKPISKGLSKEPIYVLSVAEYGTDKGWKSNKVIIAKDKIYLDNTPVHTLIVGGNHTFFANGYLVSGFATDVDYDYNNVKIEDLQLNYEKV